MWKQAGTVISTIDVPRKDDMQNENGVKIVRYPDLAAKIQSEWQTVGAHRDASDRKFDQAILHTDNETAYVYVIGVIDAIYQAKRPWAIGGKTDSVSSFNVTFAVN